MKRINVYAIEKLAKHHIFTNLNPEILEKKLLNYLSDRNEMEPLQNKENYELKFSLGKRCKAKPANETLTQADADLEDKLEEAMQTLGLVEMTMRITKTPDDKEAEILYAVEFLGKDDVDQFRFDKAAVELIKNCLAFAIE